MIHNFQIGLGGGVPDGPSFEALDCALKCGIRFFDTSTLYSPGDFDRLNECLQSNQVKRSEVHISLKLWLSAFEKNRQFDYDPFKFSIKENIKAYLLSVNLDYLDSVVIHWPLKVDAEGFPEEFIVEEIWPQLELLVASGIVKEIGVSNFNIIELQRLLAIAKVHPFANQIEFSPFAFNIELKKFCLDHNIRVVGHSPFNYGWKNNQPPLLKNKIIENICYKYQKTSAQIILAWACSHGVTPIPGSKNLKHIEEIAQAPLIKLTDIEIQEINQLNEEAYCYSEIGDFFKQIQYLKLNIPNIEVQILGEDGKYTSTYLYDINFVRKIKTALTHGPGFVIIPNIFNKLTQQLSTDLESKQTLTLGRWNGYGPNNKDSILNSGESVLRLIDDPLISLLTQSLLGWDCKLDNLALSTSRVAPNNDSLGPHQDSPFEQNPGCPLPPQEYPLVLQTIFTIDDFTNENGPLFVIPGSHQKKQRVNLPWGGNIPKGSTPQNAVKVIVPKGTAILAVGHIWHGATSNMTNKTRRGFLIEFVSSICEPRERFTTENVNDTALSLFSRRLLRLISDGKRFFYDSPSLLIRYKELLKDKIPDYAKGSKVPHKLEKLIYTANIITLGGRNGSSESDDKEFNVSLSLPLIMGGTGKATNPEQLLGAGFSASFLTTLYQVAEQKMVQLPSNITINARVDLGSTEIGLGLAVSLTINIFDLNQTLANDLVLAAMKICPYCNAFKDNVPINISLISGG